MKNLMIVFCAFLLVFNQANAASTLSLKSVFDDLNYAVEVEWDQKDQQFLQDQKDLLQSRLMELKEQGVTIDEMTDFAIASVKDKGLAKDLDVLFDLLKNDQIKESEALNMLKMRKDSGASWSGRTGLYVTVPLLIVAVIVLVSASTCSKSDGKVCGKTDHL